MIRLMVDFNDVQDGIVTGLAESLSGSHAAGVGDRVLLHDDGEHEMWATVTSVRHGLIEAAVEWTTWRPARRGRVRNWKQRVPTLITDALPAFDPRGVFAIAPTLTWADRDGESTNVCAHPSLTSHT
jgi:hypothetical protein